MKCFQRLRLFRPPEIRPREHQLIICQAKNFKAGEIKSFVTENTTPKIQRGNNSKLHRRRISVYNDVFVDRWVIFTRSASFFSVSFTDNLGHRSFDKNDYVCWHVVGKQPIRHQLPTMAVCQNIDVVCLRREASVRFSTVLCGDVTATTLRYVLLGEDNMDSRCQPPDFRKGTVTSLLHGIEHTLLTHSEGSCEWPPTLLSATRRGATA